ncbi:hypothetical protein MF672_032545 [Actinomadura sp. ATCC 31491]|uniref:Uncharacterized protein n=1 Tax=Actinomadura luzonensis TaxID=2805427 RepID=A0ABT0G302_9ACTN|nr:hypothetical protein [Actinomadura luzonensis]MCK2218491.1 hypothetical protein [Actinomadura luzonensis]
MRAVHRAESRRDRRGRDGRRRDGRRRTDAAGTDAAGTDAAGTDAVGTDAVGVDAAAFLRRAGESRAAAELATGVRQGVHPDDVALCLELDRFPFAMVASMEGPLMVLRPHAVPAPGDEPPG